MRTNLSSQIILSQVSKKLYQPDDVFELSRVTRLERVKTKIYETDDEGTLHVANRIARLITEKQEKFEKFVLGIVAGQSTIGIYEELVRKHEQEHLSFKNVVLFNLYEYFPLSNTKTGCFAELKEIFIDKIDVLPENVYTMNGCVNKENVFDECAEYERKIEAAGGIDFQILGIGRGGNIGFNEPGSQINSTTRLVLLDNVSKNDAVNLFGSMDAVPISALTMGVGTIMKSQEIALVAWGEHKAAQVTEAIEEENDITRPASALQLHKNAYFVLNLPAASELTRLSKPWLLTSCQWDDKLIRRAIVWLCEKTQKPILKLTNKDYNEYGLNELLAIYGAAYNVNIKIFNDLQHTITGWPGGKPNTDDTNRPERANPFPKTSLIFSPHPDDDVISMGGTFSRLIKQGHNVHVAYETSGNIAVADDEVIRFLAFMKGFKKLHDPENDTLEAKFDEFKDFLLNQKTDRDTREILALKALIRRGEAREACRHMGLPIKNAHFLNLPFYETGAVKKGDLGRADVDIVKNLLTELQPDQIFVAGDLADPHGTHRVCLDAILAAIDELKGEAWLDNCRIWMYRGAWKEWEIDHIEMAVPISPEELRFKRNTILKHQSQMESAPFMGNDERLFWQRAEDRNRATAELYAHLGLASYEAIEAFVQYRPL